jgi:hypothetical protein
MEPFGWDRHDRTYFVLDDNRIYRLTDAPLAAAKPKKNTQKARAAARARKRRRVSALLDSDAEEGGDEATENEADRGAKKEEDELGGMKWECVAVSLEEVNQFLDSIKKTTNANERILRDQIQDHLVPILASLEERRKKREREREREMLNLAKLANAKRSSRIANRVEHQKQEEVAREEEQKRLVEEAAARKAEQLRRKMEKERDNRQMSREQRLRERESRRLKHEEELAQLSEDSRSMSVTSGRMSERQRLAEIQKNKQALQELDEEDEEWVFDCICGLHGKVDDGEHSVSCERCNVWQHSKCLGIDEKEAEREDFHFICDSCRRRQEEKEQLRTRPIIKIKVNRPAVPGSLPNSSPPAAMAQGPPPKLDRIVVEIPSKQQPLALGHSEIPRADGVIPPKVNPANGLRFPGTQLPPPTQDFSISIPVKNAIPLPSTSPTDSRGTVSRGLNGGQNPFSSPHPFLPPPEQSPNKARAYAALYSSTSPGSALRRSPSRDLGNSPAAVSPVLPRAGTSEATFRRESIGSPAQPQPDTLSKGALPPLGTFSTQPRPTYAASIPPKQSPKMAPSPMAMTPRINMRDADPHYDPRSSPLPPSTGGLSPTKHSPPAVPRVPSGHGLPSSSPTPPILTQVPALSPVQRPQILVPPVKQPAAPRQGFPHANTAVQPSSLTGEASR